MTRPVATPRGTYDSISDLARLLGHTPQALRRYLIWRGEAWHLIPLDEQAYDKWHADVWRRAQREKGQCISSEL